MSDSNSIVVIERTSLNVYGADIFNCSRHSHVAATMLQCCLQSLAQLYTNFPEKVFASMFDPQAEPESLSEFFSTGYIQDADGARVNFNGFIEHTRVLKNTFRSGRVTFEDIIVDGPKIAECASSRLPGERRHSPVKVIALFTLAESKIVKVDDLMHLLKGADTDRDFGFRTSR